MVADAALSWLARRPEADRSRVGCVGFCFGGRQALFEAARNPVVKATVALYGSGLLTTPEALGVLDGSHPLLGVYVRRARPFDFGRATSGLRQAVGGPRRSVHGGGISRSRPRLREGHRVDLPGPAADAWKKVLAFLGQNL